MEITVPPVGISGGVVGGGVVGDEVMGVWSMVTA
ncbi:Uncharacterised protein [Mycobacterium tuberculosis]|nr:Uncharacterised protein [Mycobacterium tuberculosis]